MEAFPIAIAPSLGLPSRQVTYDGSITAPIFLIYSIISREKLCRAIIVQEVEIKE